MSTMTAQDSTLQVELESLEAETFEIEDYAEVGDALLGACTSTSSSSTCSSCCSCTSCSSCA